MNEDKFEHDQDMTPEEARAAINILLNMEDPDIRKLYPKEAAILQDFLKGTAELTPAIQALKVLEKS